LNINYGASLQNPFCAPSCAATKLSNLDYAKRQAADRHGGSDPNNDTNTSTDRAPFVGRNTFEGPGSQQDIRVTRDIALYKERASLRLIFEAFNLFNRANFNSITTSQYSFSATTKVFTPNASFLAPTSTYDPRILQLAAKITF
jgi:hypothetical protein